MAYPYLTDVLRALGLDVPLPIPTFGLMVATAFLTGSWLAATRVREPGQPIVQTKVQLTDLRSPALTPRRLAADNTASTEAVAMLACRPAP